MILITGGAGYIGSHTAIKFLEEGYDVVIFDNLETGHREIIDTLKTIGNVYFEKGDLRNIRDIQKLFEIYDDIDAVVHFAAFSLVGESVENPAKYYRNNVSGTINLLDAMLENNVKNIILSSTCATYGEPQYTPIDEKHPQNPINPYGNTKLIIEKILEDYDKAYGLKSIKLRYFNVAGCDSKIRIGEWHEPESHLIPNILKSAINSNKSFKIFGNDYNTPDGTCIRDYVNVEDLASAHLLAYKYLKQNQKSDAFNIGTENGTSVQTVFDLCKKITGKNINVEIAPRREGDPDILYANNSKAKSALNWQPAKTIYDSINTAYEWEKVLENKKAIR